MSLNEIVLVEDAVSNLYYLQFISIGISTFLKEHFQQVQFHLKPSLCPAMLFEMSRRELIPNDAA